MTHDRWLRVAGELIFPAGVASLVWPRLNGDLGLGAALLFVAFTIAAFVAAGPFLGSAYGSLMLRGKSPVIGQGGLLLSVQLVLIALGTAIGQTGAITAIAVPITILGVVLVTTAALRAATVDS